MREDPIIDEIRQVRRQLSEEAGNDLVEICRRLREWDVVHRTRIVRTESLEAAAPAERATSKSRTATNLPKGEAEPPIRREGA